MFEVYNELKRVNEILADAKFCDRWENDAYLYGIWSDKEGKGETTSIKIADGYASKAETYNRLSKEDYARLKSCVVKGRKASKNGYEFKAVDFIEVDEAYIDYLKPLGRDLRNILFTTLVWTEVKKSCGMDTDIIYFDSEKLKLAKQAHAQFKPKEVEPYFTEEIKVKYGRKNKAGTRGYHVSWIDNITLTGETLRIKGSSPEPGYAYGDYMNDDLHNPGRWLDELIYGTTKCAKCGNNVIKHRTHMFNGKHYCDSCIEEVKLDKKIDEWNAAIDTPKTDITTVCRRCGKSFTILSTNRAWDTAVTGNYVCPDCRKNAAKVEKVKKICTRCGKEFTVNKKAANYEEIAAGTNCECSKCFKKTRREREKLSKLEKK